MKNYTTHACELYTTRLHKAASAFFEPLGALNNLLTNCITPYVLKASAWKVPVRTQHPRPFSRSIFGALEIAGNVEAGDAFEIDFFDGVITLVDCAMNDRIQR